MGRLVVVSGVGTGIGKTHLARSLVRAGAGQGLRVAGYKPVESGAVEGQGADAQQLLSVSTFHVKPSPLYALALPLSPHLAARRAGISIDLERIVAAINGALEATDLLVVELAGGLFSPLTDSLDNADLLGRLPRPLSILVAPDRLGVLHEVRASLFAARSLGLNLGFLVLVAPESPDLSTGTNAAELAPLFHTLAYVPRVHADSEPCEGTVGLLQALLAAHL